MPQRLAFLLDCQRSAFALGYRLERSQNAPLPQRLGLSGIRLPRLPNFTPRAFFLQVAFLFLLRKSRG